MLIDVVDDSDRPVGIITRGKVLEEGANFRTAHLLILDPTRSHVLLQRIPHHQNRHPDHLGSSVASYLFAGESYAQAIERRAYEELGLGTKDISLVACGRTSMVDGHSLKFIGVFMAIHGGPFRPDNHHISAIDWVPVDRVDEMLDDPGLHTLPFTPTFRIVWRHFRSPIFGPFR